MGFLSRYSGTDTVDLGDSYSVTIAQHLPGDAQEAAEAAKVRAVANVRTEEGETQRSVEVSTSTDMAAYTTALLDAAIVSWNLTDEYDRVLPLNPHEDRIASIKRLPAQVRTQIRDRIEANIKAESRTGEEQKQFRGADDGGAPVGEGRPAGSAGSPAAGSLLDPAGSNGS